MLAVLALVGTALGACASAPSPVLAPCGVIKDSLQDVQATTPTGNERLAVHYARGHSAKCW